MKLNIKWKILGKATALVAGGGSLLFGIVWLCNKCPVIPCVLFGIGLICVVYWLMDKDGEE